MVAKTVENVRETTLLPFVKECVMPNSLVCTDEHLPHRKLGQMGFIHKRIQHKLGVYVSADVHTNTIESFWSLFKRSVDGSHHSISAKYMQNYLNEYTFRWNHRKDAQPMLVAFMSQVQSVQSDRANERIRA